MNENEDENIIVVVVRYQGEIRYYQSDQDLWVLDVNKWRNEFIAHGYDMPEFNDDFRFGIKIVNEKTVDKFLTSMSCYEVEKDELSYQLAIRYQTAYSFWDVIDLFPVIFVNFDEKKVAGFYPQPNVRLEYYIADGWQGEFIDFALEYPEETFPKSEKFWVKGDEDLLVMLNERGANLKN
jgi:hypothetical protein